MQNPNSSAALPFAVATDSGIVRAVYVATILAAVAACSSNVQQPATQFGQAVTISVGAESSLFDAVDKKKATDFTLSVLSGGRVMAGADGGPTSQAASKLSGAALSAADRKAISTVLDALTAYGQALQNIAGDTAATTFNSNTDELGTAAAAVDKSVLTPLGGKGLPTTIQITDVGTAIKGIGDIVLSHIIAKDVKGAAKAVDPHLRTITQTLQGVNNHWANEGQQYSNDIQNLCQNEANQSRDFSVKYQMIQIWQGEIQNPLSATAANNALSTLVTANSKIADAGPSSSVSDIQAAFKAASDAYTAYKAITGK